MLELNEIWVLCPVLPLHGRQKQEVSRLLKLEPGKILPFLKLLIIFGCTGSSLLHDGFLWLWRERATLQMWCPLLLWWLLLLQNAGSRVRGLQSLQHAGSVIVVHGYCCPVACGIFPDQGSNPGPLHWQVDS